MKPITENIIEQSAIEILQSLELEFERKGEFTFKAAETLSQKCNAPKDAGGIYIVTDVNTKTIIYIGRSGWVCQNGIFAIRKGGMYDRIVNGKQFGKPRNVSWKLKMKEQKIEKIKVEWFVTFNEKLKHIPAYVEACCIQKFFEEHNSLPAWNAKF